MVFPENLKMLRCSQGYGQKKLADELHTTVKTISHWETGYSEPSIAQLVSIANLFNISLDELVGRDFKQI